MRGQIVMSALPSEADIRQRDQDVCFGPEADMGSNAVSLNLVGRWRTRSVRCDQRQSESAVARCRCKPLAGRIGYHRTSAASCRYLQCGCTTERKPAKQDR